MGKKVLKVLVDNLNAVLFVITFFSILQIVLGLFELPVMVVSQKVADVLDNLSLSWIGGYIFYLLVVFIPDRRNSYYRSKYVFKFVVQSIDVWKQIKDLIFRKDAIELTEVSLLDSFHKFSKAMDLYSWHLDNLEKYISKALNLNSQFDPELVHYLDVVYRNLVLVIKNPMESDEVTKADWVMPSFVKIDKCFSYIEHNWKDELRIAKERSEVHEAMS